MPTRWNWLFSVRQIGAAYALPTEQRWEMELWIRSKKRAHY